ncbi:hypothetical protein GCM10011581_42620 [Saccharopolyspora subtropica]|uniref:DUF3558 domain-containing protein n=1 Tax=Saccharopolyspora thermophila TaxID=89367 RepID=A0A917K6K1_9PSEU|nr:DUF3558 domain-containing protein [Saccharopolyspora subtropica]GGJ00918.1 hypothetical protein GCM10011581_42620 [Saccharopolyspora subtropica]
MPTAWDGLSDLIVIMRTTRVTAVAALTVTGLLLGGCGGPRGAEAPSSTNQPPTNETSALASLDPCTVLPQAELQSIGVTKPGEFVDQGTGESGCDFNAGDFLLTIYKAEKDDLSYWRGQRDNFAVFEPNQVGSRNGIKAVTKGSEGQGLCRQIMESGGGSVSIAITYRADKIQGNDPCAKALEIARLVEPKLPK